MYDVWTQSPVLYDNLEEWDVDGNGIGSQEGGAIRISNADLCYYIAKAIKIL